MAKRNSSTKRRRLSPIERCFVEYGYDYAYEQMRLDTHRLRAVRWSCTVITLTTEEWFDLLKAHNHACKYCHGHERVGLDHVLRLKNGGTHDKTNIVPACIW